MVFLSLQSRTPTIKTSRLCSPAQLRTNNIGVVFFHHFLWNLCPNHITFFPANAGIQTSTQYQLLTISFL